MEHFNVADVAIGSHVNLVVNYCIYSLIQSIGPGSCSEGQKSQRHCCRTRKDWRHGVQRPDTASTQLKGSGTTTSVFSDVDFILKRFLQVLSEKRRKLHETWHRVIKMYERESPEQYVDLKKLWLSYQNRKREVVGQYEAVKNAQNVTVDSIPLPSGDMSGTGKIKVQLQVNVVSWPHPRFFSMYTLFAKIPQDEWSTERVLLQNFCC